jgi:aminopeptidase N
LDLSRFTGWYSQAGTPELAASRVTTDDVQSFAIEFTQNIPETMAKTPRLPLPIPVRLGLVGDDGAIVPFRLSADAPYLDEQVILVSSKTHLQPIFPASSGKIVPSLLRNFSAPVILKDDLSSSERLHLMAHDADMFNRWDAAQTLLADQILAIAHDPKYGVDKTAISALAKAYANSLADPDLLDLFKSGLLTLPAISVLESRMVPADPVALFYARRTVEAALGRMLAPQIRSALTDDNTIIMAKKDGGRALLNRLLGLAIAAGDNNAIERAARQVYDQNMTLSQGALMALNHCAHPARAIALQVFHDRWQDSPLVMEKWFMMESMSLVSGTVARLGELMAHPAFDGNNPNKLRSVLGAFMTGNPVHFYADDGSGFDFIGDRLIDIDARNPQLAARMALPLTRMAQYGPKRRAKMGAVLQKIQKQAHSNDLREVIDKALTDSPSPA